MNLAVDDTLTVNSFHHRAIDPDNLGGIKITATAFDGSIETIELDTPERMVPGVQFSPERMDDISGKLFGYFCSKAQIYKEKKPF